MNNAKQQARDGSGRTSVRRWLALPVVAALALAACGEAEDEVTAGIVADATQSETTDSTIGDDESSDGSQSDAGDDDASGGDQNDGDSNDGDQNDGDSNDAGTTDGDGGIDDGGIDDGADEGADDGAAEPDSDEGGDAMADDEPIRTESFDEVLSAEPAEIDEIVALDDTTIGVRFTNAAEPCARARVRVTETDDAVTVGLETGLHPNAAAMSCIAAVMQYEIPVALDDAIGNRALVATPPTGGDSGGSGDSDDDQSGDRDDQETGDPGDDVSNELAGYVGLTEADAEAKAQQDGRPYRIERRDGEDFALTMDFSPDRVNVSIENGVVVAARTG